MAPKRIDKVSVFQNMNAEQADEYLSDLLTHTTAEGVLMFATDIRGIHHLIKELVELKQKKTKS